MPGSSAVISSGGIAGLTLRAWAMVAANGTLLGGFNVASITKGITGNYTINFSQAMADTTVLHDIKFPFSTNTRGLSVLNASAGSVSYAVTESAAYADIPHYMALYGK